MVIEKAKLGFYVYLYYKQPKKNSKLLSDINGIKIRLTNIIKFKTIFK